MVVLRHFATAPSLGEGGGQRELSNGHAVAAGDEGEVRAEDGVSSIRRGNVAHELMAFRRAGAQGSRGGGGLDIVGGKRVRGCLFLLTKNGVLQNVKETPQKEQE